ncbi:MAG TPA: hypothetical protein VHY30_07540 [Verrucomicrobiae bacterium]|nr:hypothetical protein [Verrucomicrobiae bacterium]
MWPLKDLDFSGLGSALPDIFSKQVRQSDRRLDSSNDALRHRVSSSAEDVRAQPKTVGS